MKNPTLISMQNIRYFDAPEILTAFKVTLDCCVERVVYGGEKHAVGVNAINDNAGNNLNSDHYWCPECGVPFKMVQISSLDYWLKYDQANKLRSSN